MAGANSNFVAKLWFEANSTIVCCPKKQIVTSDVTSMPMLFPGYLDMMHLFVLSWLLRDSFHHRKGCPEAMSPTFWYLWSRRRVFKLRETQTPTEDWQPCLQISWMASTWTGIKLPPLREKNKTKQNLKIIGLGSGLSLWQPRYFRFRFQFTGGSRFLNKAFFWGG